MSIEPAWDRIGCPIEDIDTPALLIEAAALERRAGDRDRTARLDL